MSPRARLVLADDDYLLREGLASLLELNGFEVAGRAGDVAELNELVHECAPDVALVDVRMPPTHTTEGLDAAVALRQQHPELGILVLSAHVEVQQAMELMSGRGGIGYLLKTRVTDLDDLLDAVDRVASGRSAVDPDVVRELFATQRTHDPLES